MGWSLRYGLLWFLSGFAWIAGRTRLADAFAEQVRRAAAAGPVVYVLPSASVLDERSLDAALASRGLPTIGYAPGVSSAWSGPLRRLRDALRDRRTPAERVAGALRERTAVCLAVEDRRLWAAPDALPEVVRALAEHPDVQVLPVMVVWDRSPDTAEPVRAFFLGKRGVVGWIRRVFASVRGQRAFLQVGLPVALADVRARVGDERLAGVLRRMMARAHHVEVRTVRGPVLAPPHELRRTVLASPPMKAFAREEAARSGVPVAAVERQMAREYDRVAANFSWTFVQLGHVLLRPLWTRVFRGVDAPPEDVERIRAAMRDGTAILVPSHKSHFDYVLLSWFLYDRGMIIPHVAAGMNMAIWPLSVALRGVGGFFLRRSLKGEPVAARVFERYLRELVLREYPVEFFPEGGRTRSGKLLPPRLGVLSMVLDAAAVRAHGREVTLLPVAFMYEQVAEEATYARELGGEPKTAESMGQVLRATRVFGRRYGRVFLRVGEPIPCGPLVEGWSERPEADRRAVVKRVGDLVLHRIGRNTVALPSSLVALALLALPRRGVRHAELVDRTRRFLARLRELGCPVSPVFGAFDESVALILDRFSRDGHVVPLGTAADRVWEVLPERRVALDFHKNQVLHWLAPAGLAACALRAQPDAAAPEPDALARAFEDLRRLWRREFTWDPDADPATFLAGGLATLRAHGAIDADAVVIDASRIGEIYGLFRSLLEGYRAALGADAYRGADRVTDRVAEAIAADRGARLAPPLPTRPESLSLVTLQNAVATLAEEPDQGAAARAMLRAMTE